MRRELNDKQRLFCKEYLKEFNATKAYELIYKVEYATAKTAGPRMLENVDIQHYVKSQVVKKTKAIDLDVKDLLTLLKNASFMDIKDFMNLEKIEGDRQVDGRGFITVTPTEFKSLEKWQRQLITEVQQDRFGAIKIKFFAKEKAVELLGKYFNLFNDTTNIINMPEGLTVNIVKKNESD